MPVSGPYSHEVENNAAEKIDTISTPDKTDDRVQNEYVIVNANMSLPSAIKSFKGYDNFLSWPQDDDISPLLVQRGDTLSITIFESEVGGLFIPSQAGIRPGNFISLPNQIIDSSGKIVVPYAGSITAHNRTTHDIAQEITEKLSNQAIQPQVIVNFARRGNGSQVSILGAVNDAKRYPLDFAGERILDAIANAGGPSSEGYDTQVMLQRDGKEYLIHFDMISDNPANNIYLKAGDVVYLYSEARSFSLLGAVNFPARYTFNKKTMTLSEAIGKGGDLNDNRADAANVYVYRKERKDFVDHLAGKTMDPDQLSEEGDKDQSVIYRFNLRNPQEYFVAQDFYIRDLDIIHVTNSETTELLKIIGIVNPTSVTTINTRSAKESYF